MENNGRQVQQNKSRVINLGNAGNSIFMKFYSVSVLIVIMVVWYFLAKKIDNNLLLPDFLFNLQRIFSFLGRPLYCSKFAYNIRACI